MTNGSGPHRKFKDSVHGIERGLHRAIDLASGDLTAPKYLDIPSFKVYVQEDRDQTLAESIYVIEIRQRATKLVVGRRLRSFQRGCHGRFQWTVSVSSVDSISVEGDLIQSQRN